MSKGRIRKIYEWFRDSQLRLERQEIVDERLSRAVTKQPGKARREERLEGFEKRREEERRTRYVAPHYYAFYYKLVGPDRRGKRPKEYLGPFKTQTSVRDAVVADMKKYGTPRDAYKVQRLTSAQFEEIWGVPPIPPEEQ
jgi:hypothetical protein